MTSNTDEEFVVPTTSMIANSLSVEDTTYPSPDFTVAPRHNASSIPLSGGLTYLSHISTPTVLDSNVIAAAARLVAKMRGSNLVDPSVLWAPSHQHVLSSEIALIATDAPW